VFGLLWKVLMDVFRLRIIIIISEKLGKVGVS